MMPTERFEEEMRRFSPAITYGYSPPSSRLSGVALASLLSPEPEQGQRDPLTKAQAKSAKSRRKSAKASRRRNRQ